MLNRQFSVAHIFQLTKFGIITRWHFDHATSYVPHILAAASRGGCRDSTSSGVLEGGGGVSRENFSQGISNICATQKTQHKKRNYLCCTVKGEGKGDGAAEG